ncbi:MAG: 4Fe-4S binding protein [Candidatus Bathycorpusculaceae bacterium]
MQKAKIRQALVKFNTPRRIVQFLSFLFFSVPAFNPSTLQLLLPILWTWGLNKNTIGDALTAIQLMFYNAVFPWLALASFFIVGILLGKSLCGWVCPFGFIQDLTGLIRLKKKEFPPKTHRNMLYMKYVVLGITLFISVTFSAAKVAGVHETYESAVGIFAKVPFTAVSPTETLFATLPHLVRDFSVAITEKPVLNVLSGIFSLPPLFWVQTALMIGVIVFSIFVPKGWCRYLCPHGAFMAILNRFSFLGLRRDPVKCVKGACRVCVEVCPMRVQILDLPWEKFSDPECIYCLKCVDACQNKAIRLKYP